MASRRVFYLSLEISVKVIEGKVGTSTRQLLEEEESTAESSIEPLLWFATIECVVFILAGWSSFWHADPASFEFMEIKVIHF